MSNFKPCPFCGSKNITYYHTFDLCCNDCEASGPEMETEEQAVEGWNKRDDKRIAKLEKELKEANEAIRFLKKELIDNFIPSYPGKHKQAIERALKDG
jgi:Lar family restriction alleviation protein